MFINQMQAQIKNSLNMKKTNYKLRFSSLEVRSSKILLKSMHKDFESFHVVVRFLYMHNEKIFVQTPYKKTRKSYAAIFYMEFA